MKIENIPQYKYDIPNLLNTTLNKFDELMSVYNSLQENDQITYNNYQALSKRQKYNASQLSFVPYKKLLDEGETLNFRNTKCSNYTERYFKAINRP